MIKFEKIHALTSKNLCNSGAHCIIEILSVLRNTHMVPRDQDKFLFYVILIEINLTNYMILIR